jgi:hypothetical protein
VTELARSPSGSGAAGPVNADWAGYLAATRQLDEVRRDAAAVAAEQAKALRTAHEQLAATRGRMAANHARIRETAAQSGAPAPALAPTPPELAEAARATAGTPASALSALHEAWATVDEADAALVGTPGSGLGPATLPPRLRNMLVYGPLALVVLVIQVILYSVVSETALPIYAPLCALIMPALAFALGFVTISLVFPAPPGGRVEHTPLLGLAICLSPIVVICAGLGMFAAVR